MIVNPNVVAAATKAKHNDAREVRQNYYRQLGIPLPLHQVRSFEHLRTSWALDEVPGALEVSTLGSSGLSFVSRDGAVPGVGLGENSSLDVSSSSLKHMPTKSGSSSRRHGGWLLKLAIAIGVAAIAVTWEFGSVAGLCRANKSSFLETFVLPSHVKADLTQGLLASKISSIKTASNAEELESKIALCQSFTESKLHASGQQAVLNAISRLRLGPTKAVLIRNVPQDPYVPPTPVNGSRSLEMTHAVAECMMIGFAQQVAELVAYDKWEKEYDNGFIHTGFPLKGGGSALISRGSIPWHLDMSYLPLKLIPDLFVLTNLREGHDKKLVTTLLSNEDILAKIEPRFQKVLREQRFVLNKAKWVSDWEPLPQPLLLGSDESPTIIAPSGGEAAVSVALPEDTVAQEALDALYEAIRNVEEEGLVTAVHLMPGDVLLFNNKSVLHSRRSFSEPLFDGLDRILQRSYYLFSLDGIDIENRNIVQVLDGESIAEEVYGAHGDIVSGATLE